MDADQSTKTDDEQTPYVAPAGVEIGTVRDLTQTKGGPGGDSYGALTLAS